MSRLENPLSTNPWSVESRELTRRIVSDDAHSLIDKEWLVTNGLGGYASGSIAGAATRRYHGLLIGSHPAPRGRVVHLSHLGEQFGFGDTASTAFGVIEHANRALELNALKSLLEFRMDFGLPVWRYATDGVVIEKRIYMPHLQNTVYVNYRIVDGDDPLQLDLRVSAHFRGYEESVSAPNPEPYILTASAGRYELVDEKQSFPPVRFTIQGDSTSFVFAELNLPEILFRLEAGRGYDSIGRMSSPGIFRAMLSPDRDVTLTASTEPWERLKAFSPETAWDVELHRRSRLIDAAGSTCDDDFSKELVLAADQFIIQPAGRVEDSARAEASGEQARTIIAGYHWFTDWGRDTMISLEGLTLVTGRHTEARSILRTFINHVRDGLIPNFFPDRSSEGVYHTADATLWYFHALGRYLAVTGDRSLLYNHLPALKEIVACHQRGTRFGIHVDDSDGLLCQGADGYQLTWMDAKVGDWVVTPRRGKAVEINALWYNALRLLGGWMTECGEDPSEIRTAADRAYESFNRRFWCEAERGLFDVIDGENGDDASCRPNQIFAISLPHPILDRDRWLDVVGTVQERLLTPFGLRSLAPGSPEYKSQYYGDLRSRDAAYHQGTAWAWLIGPFINAWLKVYPDRRSECRGFLAGFESHLNEACIGTISEIFDGDAPYHPRGCAAQAWSVAEVLRCRSLLSLAKGKIDERTAVV